ncbi:MAG: hypothetical protein ACOH1R_05620 [Luteimonas sp.]
MKISLKAMFLLLSITLISAATHASGAGQNSNQVRASDQEIAALLAQDSHERNEIDNTMAPIRSSAELNTYLQATPVARTPLGRLSSDARRQFVRSLTFNETGLTGFNYRALSGELSASEIYRVLSLFGMQHDTALIPNVRVVTPLDNAIMRQVSPQLCPPVEPQSHHRPLKPQATCATDHMDYQCLSRATCSHANSYICTSNC